MLGNPTVSISGSAARIASQSKKVSHRVLNGSIGRLSYRPARSSPVVPQEAADADADGAADGATAPLPGLKSAGIGRPG
ncbi:hypothetical protein GCM10027614_72730 [Micromonospora vulcania]